MQDAQVPDQTVFQSMQEKENRNLLQIKCETEIPPGDLKFHEMDS